MNKRQKKKFKKKMYKKKYINYKIYEAITVLANVSTDTILDYAPRWLFVPPDQIDTVSEVIKDTITQITKAITDSQLNNKGDDEDE